MSYLLSHNVLVLSQKAKVIYERPAYRIGQSGSALVEQDQPREGYQPFEECQRVRFLPRQLQMGDEPGREQEVARPLATTW